jgi:hypothetical protein
MLLSIVWERLSSEIYKLIKLIWNKEELPHQWKESVVPIHKKGDKTECSNYRGISLLSNSYKILSSTVIARLILMQMKSLGITSVDFDVIGDLLFPSDTGKKWDYNGALYQKSLWFS